MSEIRTPDDPEDRIIDEKIDGSKKSITVMENNPEIPSGRRTEELRKTKKPMRKIHIGFLLKHGGNLLSQNL
jgi:hypothetical protein